jgi:hypothetical protein
LKTQLRGEKKLIQAWLSVDLLERTRAITGKNTASSITIALEFYNEHHQDELARLTKDYDLKKAELELIEHKIKKLVVQAPKIVERPQKEPLKPKKTECSPKRTEKELNKIWEDGIVPLLQRLKKQGDGSTITVRENNWKSWMELFDLTHEELEKKVALWVGCSVSVSVSMCSSSSSSSSRR